MAFHKGQSGNPTGRPKLQVVGDNTPIKYNNSVLTIRGKIERFLKKNMTGRQLQLMYSGLKEGQRLEMLMQLLPYVLSKPTGDSVTADQVAQAIELMKQEVLNTAKEKKIS